MCRVLEQGCIAEFDAPAALLAKKDSMFTQLVKDTGPEAEQYLRHMAKVAAQRKADKTSVNSGTA